MKNVNTPLTDEDVLAECRYQSAQASGSEFASDELTESRKNALRYYLGRPRGDEQAGKSSFISQDVADTIDAMVVQIMATIKGDNIVSFEPESQEDEEQARIESKHCNNIVMEQNGGFILIQTLVKDALLSKNATAKVSVHTDLDIKEEKYVKLSKEEQAMLLNSAEEGQSIQVKSKGKNGDMTISRITSARRIKVDAVAPENFSVTSEHKNQDLETVTYCVERFWKTKSDLLKMGYDAELVMEILPTATTDTKIDSIERNQINDEQNFFNTSPSMQIVELEEHYIRIDQDGDGIAELHKVVTSENNLLSNDIVDYVPYANGIAFLMGHRFYGLSVYDKLKSIEDIKTHFLRQWSDNALVHNHKKYVAVEDQVNIDDLVNGRPNGVIRVESLDSLMELQTTDIAPSCVAALDYFDKIRTERSGAALDLQSNQVSMPSNVGDQGVSALIKNLEDVTALITKNLSETLLRQIYKLVHNFSRMYFPQEMYSAKMNGEWSKTSPQSWLKRNRVNVTMPPTQSMKVEQQVALEKAIIQGSTDLQSGKGGVTITEANIYQMKLDHMRLSGIDNPEKYLTNPTSEQAQQVAQQNAQQAAEQAQTQQQLEQAQIQAQMDSTAQLTEAQVMEVKRNWENDKEQLQFDFIELSKKLEFEKYKVDMKSELDEAKIIGDATTKLEVESLKQKGERKKQEAEAIMRMADNANANATKEIDIAFAMDEAEHGMMGDDDESESDNKTD